MGLERKDPSRGGASSRMGVGSWMLRPKELWDCWARAVQGRTQLEEQGARRTTWSWLQAQTLHSMSLAKALCANNPSIRLCLWHPSAKLRQQRTRWSGGLHRIPGRKKGRSYLGVALPWQLRRDLWLAGWPTFFALQAFQVERPRIQRRSSSPLQ